MPAIYKGDKIKIRGNEDKYRIEEIDWEHRRVRIKPPAEWVPFRAILEIAEPVRVSGRQVI